MASIPEAAVDPAAAALCDLHHLDPGWARTLARAALEAAAPLLAGAQGRATVKTEWGVRYDQHGNGRVDSYGDGPRAEYRARMDAADGPDVLVRRTVTYGEWEEVPGG